MIIGLAITRYLVSSEGHEMALTPSYTCDNIEAARKALDYASAPFDPTTLELPPELGTWREMTDAEARDYILRQEDEKFVADEDSEEDDG